MATKLVSVKISKAERKKMSEPSSLAEGDQPLYPWGLSISLDTETLTKMGIDTLPDVGESYMLIAKVDVTNVSSNESEGGKSRSVGLQITDLCLEDADSIAGKKNVIDSLYGAAKG